MLKNNFSQIDVLGAGPGGLGVGYYAKKYGIPISIFELSNSVGGNSRTITNGQFLSDTYVITSNINDAKHYGINNENIIPRGCSWYFWMFKNK